MVEYSIVATSYNNGADIGRYLASIINQTLIPKEIVIADGGSTDNTIGIIKTISCSCDIPMVVIEGKRLNIPEGYNVAIRNTSCEYIGITGIGNEYEEKYFEKLFFGLEKNKVDIAYSPIRGKVTNHFSESYCKTILSGDDGQRLPIASNHGVLLKKNVFSKSGYFYEKFIRSGEDVEFYERTKAMGITQTRVEDAIVLWDIPKNFKEFKTQNKLYTIANLQISENKKLVIRAVKDGIPFLFGLLLVLVAIFIKKYWSIIVVVVILFIYSLKKIYEHKSPSLCLCSKFLHFYYTIRYWKYTGKQYKVSAEK